MKIVFVQTGGTIDKDSENKERICLRNRGACRKKILQKVNPNFDFEIIPLLKKDSLDITEEDRKKIHEARQKADSDKIVVTHGTDTIIETAKKLSDIKNKVIVLTGAMRPEKLSYSDASFNVGTAIGAINILKNGVYIAMNGRVYPSHNVKRNPKTGQFTENQKAPTSTLG